MSNKKKTKRARKKAGKKFYSAFVLFIFVTLVFIFMSFSSNLASNNQNSLWAQMMEAFLRGDEAKKESLLQRIRESEAQAAASTTAPTTRSAGVAQTQPPQSGTTAANWRDYDWSRFGITNPAYGGRKSSDRGTQREIETETLPTVVYEDWDPYNYSNLYEESKKSKVLTPRFETTYIFSDSEEPSTEYIADEVDWSTFDWSTFYKETKKSDVIKPTYETTTVMPKTWQEWFRPSLSETTQEVYNIPKETTKSSILFSIFGIGGNKKEDATETLQAETIPEDDGELIVSGSLIKETKEKARIIDHKVGETTRIINYTTEAVVPVIVESRYVAETTKSAVLKPVFEVASQEETIKFVEDKNDYQEVISGSLIKESTARSRVVERVATETTRQVRRETETSPAYTETSVAKETKKSYVLTPQFNNRTNETINININRSTEEYEEVISGPLIKETSAKSRVLDKTVTQGVSGASEYYQVSNTEAETTQETYSYVAKETEKSSILFSLFGIGGRKETTASTTSPAITTTAQTVYETTKAKQKAGVLFPLFNNKRNDEKEVIETAGAYEEYEGETIVAGSIFDETKRKARVIDKSADKAQSAQYETMALLKETTFDSRPFEVRWPISLIGAGGWYFLKNVSILDSETANGKIPENYNKQLVEKLEKCRKLLGKSKKDFAIILCPDKSAIYKEFYPAGSPYPNEASKIKSFIDYAKAHSDLSVIYPDRAISFVKNVCDVYYKQDSHWNRIAGYIATRELFEMMGINYTLDSIMSHEIEVSKKLYPGDLYDDGTDVEYDLKGITDDSYVTKADYSGVDFTNDKAPMNIKAHNPVDRRSALVIRDSFIASMLPTLGAQFKNTSLYHIENYMSIDKQALQKDVIIIELTARNFISLFNLADYLISILEG